MAVASLHPLAVDVELSALGSEAGLLVTLIKENDLLGAVNRAGPSPR